MKCQRLEKTIIESLMHLIFKTIFCLRLHPPRKAIRVFPPLLPGGFILADAICLHLNKSQMGNVCAGLVERWKAFEEPAPLMNKADKEEKV